MRNLKFHQIKAQNILCFGPEGIVLDFSNLKNIVQVQGINLDAPGTENEPASNGAGKSSIQEIISVGLYGKTIKSPTKNKANRIINVLADKGEIEIEWDDFKVVRSFKKAKSGTVTSKLDLYQNANRIWDENSKITFGTSDETQKFIEEKIGLSHHAFCNVVIFDDSNTYSFLEADTPTKRQIVENLLDLEQYRSYFNTCKELKTELKKQIFDIGKEYESLSNLVESCDRRITSIKTQESNWKENKKIELKKLIGLINEKQELLKNSDYGLQLTNWEKNQDRIFTLNDEISNLESKIETIKSAIKTAQNKLNTIKLEKEDINTYIQTNNLAYKNAEIEFKKTEKLIQDLQNLQEGTTCPTCRGTIRHENFTHVLNHAREVLEKSRLAMEEKQNLIQEKKEAFGKKSALYNSIQEKIGEAEKKVSAFEVTLKNNRNEINKLNQIAKPEGDVIGKILETEISSLKKQFKSKKEEYEGESPYKEILEEAESEKTQKQIEKDAKSDELEAVEKDLPCYEFWLEAFGDNGIRKFVIDSIIPALNERMAYWLQILIDGLIEITFDNKLDETITRNGNPAFYHQMSKGEQRRINLAVSQSFAYVMMLNSGSCPSVLFLDEITGGGIDKAGVPFVYDMILELAKERQVLVTTHNESLMNMMIGCQTLTLKKHNDITQLAL